MNILENLTLEQLFRIISDPVRLSVLQQLLLQDNVEIACGGFEHNVQKATFSHHIKLMVEAGILVRREDGARKLLSISSDFFEYFPEIISLLKRFS